MNMGVTFNNQRSKSHLNVAKLVAKLVRHWRANLCTTTLRLSFHNSAFSLHPAGGLGHQAALRPHLQFQLLLDVR